MATALTSENVQDAWSALVQDVRTAVLLTLEMDGRLDRMCPMCLDQTGRERIFTLAGWHCTLNI
jgi:hypothetical protein